MYPEEKLHMFDDDSAMSGSIGPPWKPLNVGKIINWIGEWKQFFKILAHEGGWAN